MHEAVFGCLIANRQAVYSVYLSYRSVSEAPLAIVLFDVLNHCTTKNGHRVTVFWDYRRMTQFEDWEDGFQTGLLNSACFIPLVTQTKIGTVLTRPNMNLQRAKPGHTITDSGVISHGNEDDEVDITFVESLVAAALMKQTMAENSEISNSKRLRILQCIFPVFLSKPVQSEEPYRFFSPPTSRTVVRLLRKYAFFSDDKLKEPELVDINTASKYIEMQNPRWELLKEKENQYGDEKLTMEQIEFANSWKYWEMHQGFQDFKEKLKPGDDQVLLLNWSFKKIAPLVL